MLARDTRNPEYRHLIGDILVLATDLGLCNFSFIKCIDNLVAHFLARKVVLAMSFRYGLSPLLMIWLLLSLVIPCNFVFFSNNIDPWINFLKKKKKKKKANTIFND